MVPPANANLRHGSIAIQRKAGDKYEVEYNRIALTDVAAKTQYLPTEWIKNVNDISAAFEAYAAPIVGPLPVVKRIEG